MDNEGVKREVVFIHGYTGGPTDFGRLPKILEREFAANTFVPLLPGHGTVVEDLIPLSLENLLEGVEQHIARRVGAGAQVLLIGLSFGAQAALYLASKYPVVGVVAVGTTHRLTFPLHLPGIGSIGRLRRKWKKTYSSIEKAAREHATYYDEMPTNGLFISKRLRTLVHTQASSIRCPVLCIHATYDPLGSAGGVAELQRLLPSTVRGMFFDEEVHNVFFSASRNAVTKEVISFVRKGGLFGSAAPLSSDERASAIIPAYNEAPRIGAVIDTLRCVPSIGEIIVVDDGSTDGTGAVARRFSDAVYVRNERNMGKAASMERGVAHAKYNVIFFCDADLIGFKPEHAEAILQPVLNGSYDMFIGMRGNLMQRGIRAWGLNSGERALRKSVWDTLPSFYKHRYRIEAGLNRHVRQRFAKGFGWRIYNYSQPLKESKYGLIRGTLLRWWMNFDVLSAWLVYPLVEQWASKNR